MSELALIVTIAGQRTALTTADVHSVVELEGVTPVPRAPAHVLGLSALRSSNLTVIDAAAALGIASPRQPAPGTRAAIVEHAGHRYALVVDAIDDVTDILSEPAPIPGEAGPGWQHASRGLVETARGPALLISLDALLAGPQGATA